MSLFNSPQDDAILAHYAAINARRVSKAVLGSGITLGTRQFHQIEGDEGWYWYTPEHVLCTELDREIVDALTQIRDLKGDVAGKMGIRKPLPVCPECGAYNRCIADECEQ